MIGKIPATARPPLLIVLLMLMGAGEPQKRKADIPELSQRINAFSMDMLKQQARSQSV